MQNKPLALKTHKFFLLLLMLVPPSFITKVSGQEIKGSHWQIVMKDSSKLNVKKLIHVRQDTLVTSTDKNTTRVPVNSITMLIHERRGAAIKNGAIGGGIGFLIGAGLGLASGGSQNFSTGEAAIGFGFILAVPGILIGAVIGAVRKQEKVYDLRPLTLQEKNKEIIKHCSSY